MLLPENFAVPKVNIALFVSLIPFADMLNITVFSYDKLSPVILG